MRIHSCKWMVAAGLFAGGFLAYQSRPELQRWIAWHQFQVEGLDQALPSEIYILRTNRWLEFDIPSDAQMARLISNGSISTSHPAPPGAQWPYAIQYELRGGPFGTNVTGLYHFKGEHVTFLEQQSGKTVEVNFYLEHRLNPLGGRHWTLNLRDPAVANARLLRLRLHSLHPDLADVGVRVYFRTAVPHRKISYLWDRLSDEQKEDLARGNVYSFEGLSPREISCLLRYHWEVASPIGIPGRDFERRTLYIRDDSEKLQELRNWVPAGVAIDADHFGVLPLTNSSGACQLQMVDCQVTNRPPAVSNLLLWHGELSQQIETNRIVWSRAIRTTLPLNGEGLLQISSSRPIFVRAFHADPSQTNEITPEPVHLLTFTCSPTNSVEFDVDHIRQETTFFRLDVRRFTPAAAGPTTVTGLVHYTALADNGGIVQAGYVTLTNAFSPYDWLVATNGLTNITVPQSLCFIVPPSIRTLRIASPAETVLVNAYSRPSQLVKRIRVPEDYSPACAMAPEQPSWFTVRPRDQLQRREAGLTAVVRVQTRPPEYDPLVQAGLYDWDAFVPETDARGQMILLPPTDGAVPRPDSAAFTYFPVAAGPGQQVRFQAPSGSPQVAPTLLLILTNATPASALVSVDGQTLLDGRLDAPVTAVHLGNLKTGPHDLNINATAPVAAYVNYLEPATNAAWLQRFCTLASTNTLSFPYVKRSPDSEILVLRIFSPVATMPAPFDVHLRLKTANPRGIGPFSELTFVERQARVTPDPVSRTWLVAASPAQLDEGEPVFFPVGPDLPPGRYEFEVRLAAPSPRWVSLSRTTPGLSEKLNLNSQHRVN